MPVHRRTPVLVGVGVVQQRADDPRQAREPLLLMGDALERAADDAGSRALLAKADVTEPSAPVPTVSFEVSFSMSGEIAMTAFSEESAANVIESYFWRKLLVRSGLARILPRVRRELKGGDFAFGARRNASSSVAKSTLPTPLTRIRLVSIRISSWVSLPSRKLKRPIAQLILDSDPGSTAGSSATKRFTAHISKMPDLKSRGQTAKSMRRQAKPSTSWT
jgi:hypothetical protein